MSDTERTTHVCAACGHRFEAEAQPFQCPACGMTGSSRDFPSAEAFAIAKQNDAFRLGLIKGLPAGMIGRAVVTAAIRAEGRDFETACYLAVAKDDAFTEDNDPYGDHSFGAVEVMGRKVWWKIDLYDAAFEYGAPEPTNLQRTGRLLTLLFPSEY